MTTNPPPRVCNVHTVCFRAEKCLRALAVTFARSVSCRSQIRRRANGFRIVCCRKMAAVDLSAWTAGSHVSLVLQELVQIATARAVTDAP